MKRYIARRDSKTGSGLILNKDGKVAVFASENDAWKAVIDLSRLSGEYTQVKVFELGEIPTPNNNSFRV